MENPLLLYRLDLTQAFSVLCTMMFSSIPGLFPLEVASTSPAPVVTTKNVSTHCQMSPRGHNHSWEPLIQPNSFQDTAFPTALLPLPKLKLLWSACHHLTSLLLHYRPFVPSASFLVTTPLSMKISAMVLSLPPSLPLFLLLLPLLLCWLLSWNFRGGLLLKPLASKLLNPLAG